MSRLFCIANLLEVRFFVHESLKRDNKKGNDEMKKYKKPGRIKRSSLRYCCVFKVIILEN